MIKNKDTKPYNGIVYNLSVWKDESYITRLGITHNCRCYTVQTAEDPTPDENLPKITEKDVRPEFRNNVGKTGQIYKEDTANGGKPHPYFRLSNLTKYKDAFELTKLNAPHIKHSKNKKVEVSIFADRNEPEFSRNIDVALAIAEHLKLKVSLPAHINLDKYPNPEYLIGGKVADRKAVKGLKFRNALNRANVQKAEIVVIDLIDNPYSIKEVLGTLKKNFKYDSNYPSIKQVIIVSKDRKTVQMYEREQIKKGE